MFLCCKHFSHNPKLSSTPSPIILLMYTSLIYWKNNFIVNVLNAYLLGTMLITFSSVFSLNSHKTPLIMMLFSSSFDRWRKQIGTRVFPLLQTPFKKTNFFEFTSFIPYPKSATFPEVHNKLLADHSCKYLLRDFYRPDTLTGVKNTWLSNVVFLQN